eukprot:14878448-Heterocapsa_arctica.AAC.1
MGCGFVRHAGEGCQMRFALPVPFPPIVVDGFFGVVRPRLRDCPVWHKVSDLQLLRGEDVWLWGLET